MDTNNPHPQDWVTYELPIALLNNDRVKSKLVNPPVGDDFNCKGITLVAESNYEFKEPMTFDIRKIDAIYNPEFDQVMGHYRLPVFFKSRPSLLDEGYLDNGR